MKKTLIGIIILLMAIIIYFFSQSKSNLIEYKLNNKEYKLLTAKTESEWEKGLMYYKKKSDLKGADGMIFIFPNKQYQNFWNENTYLDLDVYWLSGDKVIGKDHLPSIEKTKDVFTISSPAEADKVVEIVR